MKLSNLFNKVVLVGTFVSGLLLVGCGDSVKYTEDPIKELKSEYKATATILKDEKILETVNIVLGLYNGTELYPYVKEVVGNSLTIDGEKAVFPLTALHLAYSERTELDGYGDISIVKIFSTYSKKYLDDPKDISFMVDKVRTDGGMPYVNPDTLEEIDSKTEVPLAYLPFKAKVGLDSLIKMMTASYGKDGHDWANEAIITLGNYQDFDIDHRVKLLTDIGNDINDIFTGNNTDVSTDLNFFVFVWSDSCYKNSPDAVKLYELEKEDIDRARNAWGD